MNIEIRLIQVSDNPAVARLIRDVMPEFGACGPGFAIVDPEVDTMCEAYAGARAAYFVVLADGEVVGGGGVAPLEGGPVDVCELRKMYFRSELRGKGMGQKLMDLCLEAARKAGYSRCYLETLTAMEKARALYRRNGFTPLTAPMGATGHFGCDSWFVKTL